MPEVRWWAPFCKTVERPELLEDERFRTVKDRFDNMPALIDILDEVMATKTLAEWGRIFDDAGLDLGSGVVDRRAGRTTRRPRRSGCSRRSSTPRATSAPSPRRCGSPAPTSGHAARRRRSAVTPTPCSAEIGYTADEVGRARRRRAVVGH